MPDKLLCYELNEVPWPVIDLYLKHRPDGMLARVLENADQFTTHTIDSGELHPWSTWPTLHRGVSNDVHGIRYINQDLNGAGSWPPVWQLLTEANVTVGVCGSLQSFPPLANANMLFHIPDTFAAKEETVPTKYSAFQSFNLKQTGKNKAVTSRVGAEDVATAAKLLFRSGIRPATFAKVAMHLLRERSNPLYRTRRPTLQPELAFDVLLDCMKREQPRFVTFFTNHVAGIMHRYWKYSFPEDFNYTLEDNVVDQFHTQSMILSLEQFEEHLSRLQPICERYGYELMICSSMGQEALDRGDYLPELRINDIDKLLASLDRPYQVKMNLAMHPDIAFEFPDIDELSKFRNMLSKVCDSSGRPLFEIGYNPVGTTLNMQICSSPTLVADKIVTVDNNSFTLEDIGLQLFERDIGTGYHQPKGVLIWQHERGLKQQNRNVVDSRSVLPSILEFFDVDRRDYMLPTIRGSLNTEDNSSARIMESDLAT